jgi:hypothetical protein
MPSAVVFILDILIVMLIISALNIAFLDAPIWIIAIPLALLGIIFIIWLIRRIDDKRD